MFDRLSPTNTTSRQGGLSPISCLENQAFVFQGCIVWVISIQTPQLSFSSLFACLATVLAVRWLKTNIRIHASPQAFWNLDRNWQWVCVFCVGSLSKHQLFSQHCHWKFRHFFIYAIRREKGLAQEFTLTRSVKALIQRAAECDSYYRSVTREDLLDWIPSTNRQPFSQGDQLPPFYFFPALDYYYFFYFHGSPCGAPPLAGCDAFQTSAAWLILMLANQKVVRCIIKVPVMHR